MRVIHRVSGHMLNILGVLLAAHEQKETLFGALVMERSGESSGCVYPMLNRLEAEGWVRRKWVTSAGAKPHRLCRLTASGVREARIWLERPEPPACARP